MIKKQIDNTDYKRIDDIVDMQHDFVFDAMQKGLWNEYQVEINKQQSCKPYLNNGEKYENCMVEKHNCAYETILEMYKRK